MCVTIGSISLWLETISDKKMYVNTIRLTGLPKTLASWLSLATKMYVVRTWKTEILLKGRA